MTMSENILSLAETIGADIKALWAAHDALAAQVAGLGGGTGGGLTVVDNGDGTLTIDGTTVIDNLDGTLTIDGTTVIDNLDGTLTIGA